MEITQDRVASFDYTLTDNNGTTIDSSEGREPLEYLHGKGHIIPGLEEALVGKKEGDNFTVSIPPEKGYGTRREDLIQKVDRNLFKGVEDIQAGMQFQAQTPQGVQVVTVAAVDAEGITVDANHPLAGETLNFDVIVRSVREASGEELAADEEINL